MTSASTDPRDDAKPSSPEAEGQGSPEAASSPTTPDGATPDGDEGDEHTEAEATEAEITDPATSLETELREAQDKRLRAMAELENVRRRARLDVEEARRFGASGLLLDLLTATDDLRRALAAPPEGTDTAFLEGLQLIGDQWASIFARHGVEAIAAEPGTPLDPSVHRALMEQPSDELAPGTIHTEIVRGYRLHDRLLREAQVVVVKAAEDGAPPAGD